MDELNLTSPEAKILAEGPTDGITRLSYLPDKTKSLLASTSWDGWVRIHDTNSSQLEWQHSMESGPLFSLALPESMNGVITGGMDGSIRMLEMGASTPVLVGLHDTQTISSEGRSACSCLCSLGGSSASSQLIASAGWHRKLHVWDTRQPKSAFVAELPGKAFSMDVDSSRNLLAVGTSGRRTCFVDIRYQQRDQTIEGIDILLDRESSLKFPLRCLKFFPTGDAIAVGSIEGRVAVEYLDELGRESKGKKFAFKCHRQGDLVYPVNCIEFHPRFGTFATGGCDGMVVMWDGMNKKKLMSLTRFPTSIAALAFNHDGSEIAVASSYTFEEGEREHPKDEIYVRKMLDSECRPKVK